MTLPDSATHGAGPGTVYLVPTPIGHPRDITLRAIDVLTNAAVIACEDTRHAHTLLRTLGITTRVISYHDHNEAARSAQLLDIVSGGQDVALISDAGTPLVNDPGYRLVAAAIAAGIRVCPLPGPTAVTTALIGSALPCHEFYYAGFLPRRPAARQAALARLRQLTGTLIFFEAPHRIPETVADMYATLGDRACVLARNLTKSDEFFQRGSLAELHAELADADSIRGQYTIVVAGAPTTVDDEAELLADRVATAILDHGGTRRLAREVAQEVSGLSRNDLYERIRKISSNGRTTDLGSDAGPGQHAADDDSARAAPPRDRPTRLR